MDLHIMKSSKVTFIKFKAEWILNHRHVFLLHPIDFVLLYVTFIVGLALLIKHKFVETTLYN